MRATSPRTEPFIVPDWPAPANVRAVSTTRLGGVSGGNGGPYAGLNLATHVGDDAASVARNRQWLRAAACLPGEPCWLAQVHGNVVIPAECSAPGSVADASISTTAGIVCVVQTADCLPVLLCDRDGRAVAAVHAGWRGLAAGVLENTLAAFGRVGVEPDRVLAWLGPAIGPRAFEVGCEVRAAFVEQATEAAAAFVPYRDTKFLANLFVLARQRLAACGVSGVFGGDLCTVTDAERFFSHRRDRVSGRQASLIWMAGPAATDG